MEKNDSENLESCIVLAREHASHATTLSTHGRLTLADATALAAMYAAMALMEAKLLEDPSRD